MVYLLLTTRSHVGILLVELVLLVVPPPTDPEDMFGHYNGCSWVSPVRCDPLSDHSLIYGRVNVDDERMVVSIDALSSSSTSDADVPVIVVAPAARLVMQMSNDDA